MSILIKNLLIKTYIMDENEVMREEVEDEFWMSFDDLDDDNIELLHDAM